MGKEAEMVSQCCGSPISVDAKENTYCDSCTNPCTLIPEYEMSNRELNNGYSANSEERVNGHTK